MRKIMIIILAMVFVFTAQFGWCGVVEKFAQKFGAKIESERDIGFLKEFTLSKGYKKFIVYSDKEGKHMVVGSLFNENLQNETKKRLREVNKVDISKLPLEDAIKIKEGNGNKILVMVTDPECPFCKKAHKYLMGINDKNLTIYAYLFPLKIHPQAYTKSVHILCSDNPAKEYDKVLKGEVKEFKSCSSGEDLLKKHMLLAEMLGVTGTPMFITKEGYKVEGFNKNEIEKYLNN